MGWNLSTIKKSINRLDMINQSIDGLNSEDFKDFSLNDLNYLLENVELMNSEISKIQIITKKTKDSDLFESQHENKG